MLIDSSLVVYEQYNAFFRGQQTAELSESEKRTSKTKNLLGATVDVRKQISDNDLVSAVLW